MSAATTPVSEPHPRWPADRFFWAVLAPDVSVREKLEAPSVRAELDDLLAAHLPLPAETVAAAYAQLPDGRVLACAASSEQIRAEASGAVTLTPIDLPCWLTAMPEGGLAALNVLTGPFTPRAVASARLRVPMIGAAVVTLASAIACLEFANRIATTNTAIVHASDATRALADSQAARGIPPSIEPLELRAAAEAVRLRATRAAGIRDGASDASTMLESVLRAWPADGSANLLNLRSSPSGVMIVAVAPRPDDANRLIQAMSSIRGLRPGRSEITQQFGSSETGGESIRVQMSLAIDQASVTSGASDGGTP